jgi:hypothetical protein
MTQPFNSRLETALLEAMCTVVKATHRVKLWMRYAAHQVGDIGLEPVELFTDYPIRALGDEGNTGPVRPCRIVSFNDDTHCWVEVLDPTTGGFDDHGAVVVRDSVHLWRIYTRVEHWMDPALRP